MRLDVADRKHTINTAARAVMDRHSVLVKKEPARHDSEEAFHCGCKYGKALRGLLAMRRQEVA